MPFLEKKSILAKPAIRSFFLNKWSFPHLTSQRKLRQFIGLINFYRCFIPQCAKIMQPLHLLLTHPKDKSSLIIWTEETTAAFNAIKSSLADATLLTHAVLDAPTCIMTDASDFAVGGVLQQLIDGHLHQISYFSKVLKPAETRYSTFDRELLAVYLSIKHFCYFVEGCTFHVLTDHKPLVYALHTHPSRHSPRQARHLDFIAQFTSDLRHIKGTASTPADALSRIEVNALSSNTLPVINFQAMAAVQDSDSDITRLQSSPTSLKIEAVPLATSKSKILCDTSTGVARLLVPSEFHRAVFDSLHSLAFGPHVFLRPAMYGLTSKLTHVGGPSPVYSARKPRFIDTQLHRSLLLPPLTLDLIVYTSIL